jgi:hypothetical protein
VIRLNKPYKQYEGRWIENIGKTYCTRVYFLIKFAGSGRYDWEERTKTPKPKFKVFQLSVGHNTILTRQPFSIKATGQRFVEPNEEDLHTVIDSIFKMGGI